MSRNLAYAFFIAIFGGILRRGDALRMVVRDIGRLEEYKGLLAPYRSPGRAKTLHHGIWWRCDEIVTAVARKR